MKNLIIFLLIIFEAKFLVGYLIKKRYLHDDSSILDITDLTQPTNWKELSEYYGAVEKNWKICVNCGLPGLGTGIHLEHSGTVGSTQPAIIPSEYLITRLEIIDLSYLAKLDLNLVLNLEVALQWPVMKCDPKEPTIVLFKFGWTNSDMKRKCVCKIPGLSYELAEWIAANLSHVVGVATDAPTLESEQTREMTSRTVSNVLGKSGVYIIENVNLRKRLPEHGCMALAMPLMMLGVDHVPTRLTALCPSRKGGSVSIGIRKPSQTISRINEIDLEDILN